MHSELQVGVRGLCAKKPSLTSHHASTAASDSCTGSRRVETDGARSVRGSTDGQPSSYVSFPVAPWTGPSQRQAPPAVRWDWEHRGGAMSTDSTRRAYPPRVRHFPPSGSMILLTSRIIIKLHVCRACSSIHHSHTGYNILFGERMMPIYSF